MYPKAFKPDTDIIARLKNGDESAFSSIYERYYSRVYSFIFSFLKQKQLSEEVLQETFLAIWLQRETLDADKAIEPLLFTICRRKVLDNFRRITSSEALKKQLMETLTELVNDTEDTVLYNDMVHITNAAIQKLPAQQQIVFKLSRQEGLSYDEIAGRLNLSRNTVKNHLVAALKTLRVHLGEQGMIYMWLWIFIR